MKDSICVAFDGMEITEAVELGASIRDFVGWAKIGSEMFTAYGPSAVDFFLSLGFQVFLDLKYHDIPRTVARAVKRASGWGVSLLNVHACGGSEMLQAASEAASSSQTKVIAVTALTSLDESDIHQQLFIQKELTLEDYVLSLVQTVRDAGLQGVVCSALEVRKVKSVWLGSFCVTPGIRRVEDSPEDQVRVMTPEKAILEGSDLLVIGSSITKNNNPSQAAQNIFESLESIEWK